MFACVYARIAEISERRGAVKHRRRLLAELHGSVPEVGAGSGANFRRYPASVTRVLAVEPEPYLRPHAQHAAKGTTVAASMQHGDADCLPNGELSMRAPHLCSVPSPTRTPRSPICIG